MKNTFKTIIIIFLLLNLHFNVKAQVNYQKEINEQVWKPFIETFSNNNQDGFKAVHSKEVIRVMQDDNTIWDMISISLLKKNNTGDWSKYKKSIELRFIQRIAGNDKAFEVGYYNTRTIAPDGKQRSSFGKFHVVLRKENGVWKILVDADSGKEASEEEFKKAAAME
jgi:ketosteroid isomerase-like protein